MGSLQPSIPSMFDSHVSCNLCLKDWWNTHRRPSCFLNFMPKMSINFIFKNNITHLRKFCIKRSFYIKKILPHKIIIQIIHLIFVSLESRLFSLCYQSILVSCRDLFIDWTNNSHPFITIAIQGQTPNYLLRSCSNIISLTRREGGLPRV